MATLGDFDTGTIVYGKFTTYRPSTGATFTLGGTPALSVYKDNSTTESTTGVTLTADFDARTGLNHFAIDTSADGTFYASGSAFDVVITTGTVDSISVVGSVVASFSLRKDSALKSTTAGRTLDVSAGGEAGLDWANIGSPTTTQDLSGTTVRANITHSGTAQAGATNSITLAAGASAVNGMYDPSHVRIVSGTGAGQVRYITEYNGTTKVATVDRDWRTAPDNTSVYDIIASSQMISTNEGVATGGAASTITLNSAASSVDSTYVGQTIVLRTSTGQDQARVITAYNGTTKVATVTPAWTTQPVAGTGYVMWPIGSTNVVAYGGTAGTFASGRPEVNATQLAGQTITAAAGVTFPTSVASPTNITAGTITTATSVTTVNGLAAGVITAASIAADAITDAKVAADVTIASVTGSVGSVTGAVGSVTGNVGGNVVGTVASVVGAVGSVTGNVGGNVVGSVASVTGNVGGNVVGTVGSVIAAVPLSAGDSPVMQSGTAAAGGASTITIQTALGADSLPVGCVVKITSGTGANQARVITAYVNATKVATVDRAWTTAPDNTSVYSILYAEAPALSTALKVTGVVLADTLTTYTGNTPQTGDAFARLGAPAGASVSADVAAVKTDTAAIKTKSDFLPSATAGAAGGVFIAGSNAATSITTALTANVVGNVTGNLSGSVGSVIGNVGGNVTGSVGSVSGAVGSVTGAVGSVTGNVGGNVTGSVGSIATGGIASVSFAAGAIDAAAIATDAFGALEVAAGAASEIASAVRTELTTELGRIDAAVSTRATQTSVDTIDDFIDTEVAAIKAKTDNIPAAPAAVGDIPTATQNADALLNRDMAAGTDTNARSPRNALRFLRNKWTITGTTLSVKAEDDTTEAWNATVTAAPGADPISGSDPA